MATARAAVRFPVTWPTVLACLLLAVGPALAVGAVVGPDERDISEVGWTVVFIDRTYDASTDTTTFTYDVTVATGEESLSYWTLELGTDGVPQGSGTSTSYGLDDTSGVYGFQWADGQASGTTSTYALVLNGDVGEANVGYAVVGSTYYAVSQVIGPGEVVPPPPDTFSVSGTAYVDTDGDGTRDAGESPLANVSVELYGDDGILVATVMTDASGAYSFVGLAEGTYSLSIPADSVASDFNESLAQYFLAVSSPESITLAADSSGNDFGFSINPSAVLAAIVPGDSGGGGTSLEGTGKTIGFWKHQNTVALAGRGRAQYGAATLQGFLDAVEALYLPEPFQFDDSSEFAHALDILSSTSSDEFDLLAKQLLGTELNYVAGLGLSGDGALLQEQIILLGETILANPGNYTREEVLAVKDVCDAINNSGE